MTCRVMGDTLEQLECQDHLVLLVSLVSWVHQDKRETEESLDPRVMMDL